MEEAWTALIVEIRLSKGLEFKGDAFNNVIWQPIMKKI